PVALLTDDALMVQVIQPDDETERDRETLRLTIEKQQLEIDKLRLEADYWKRKYDDRIALELLRSIGVEQTRERIGF
ncbi:MAG: transcriptional regulator, partial [Spirosoma sp.]|nr:transcriptional regulator [Spirosoma sp.]